MTTFCTICHNTGLVETRHEELDETLMTEVWLEEPCECPVGEAVQWEREKDGFEAQESEGE